MEKLCHSCDKMLDNVLMCPKCGVENRYQKTSSEIVLAVCKCGYQIVNKIDNSSLLPKQVQGITWQK